MCSQVAVIHNLFLFKKHHIIANTHVIGLLTFKKLIKAICVFKAKYVLNYSLVSLLKCRRVVTVSTSLKVP